MLRPIVQNMYLVRAGKIGRTMGQMGSKCVFRSCTVAALPPSPSLFSNHIVLQKVRHAPLKKKFPGCSCARQASCMTLCSISFSPSMQSDLLHNAKMTANPHFSSAHHLDTLVAVGPGSFSIRPATSYNKLIIAAAGSATAGTGCAAVPWRNWLGHCCGSPLTSAAAAAASWLRSKSIPAAASAAGSPDPSAPTDERQLSCGPQQRSGCLSCSFCGSCRCTATGKALLLCFCPVLLPKILKSPS